MSYQIKNNSDGKKGRKKIIAALLLLVFGIVIITSVVMAYYSDIAEKNSELNTSTLRISSTYTATLNGTVADIDNIKSLNPGDVIVVTATITNIGNQSAWIRDIISFSADESVLPYLEVYNRAMTQAEIVAGPADQPLEITGGVVTTGSKVIYGTGAGAPTESGGGFTYVGSNSYTLTLTIYFMHEAPNETQNKPIGLTISTQALQFANNNTTLPTPEQWATVRSAIA